MLEWIPEKVRRALIAGAQAGAAAGLAWWIGRVVLDADRPLYAPVAAVVVIGAGYERRLHRGGAMLSGMAVAVVTTELAMGVFGNGPLQIGLLTAVTIVIAKLVLDDLLAVSYAGLNAAILVAIGGDGWVPDRLVEALLGAGVAYGLLYLVFPPEPSRYIRRAMERQVDSAVAALRTTARALKAGDAELAFDADEESERVDRGVPDVKDTFDFSREISRFSPWRASERERTEQLWERARRLQPVLRDATATVRVARRHVEKNGDTHSDLADAMTLAAEALEIVASVACQDDPEAMGRRLDDLGQCVAAMREATGDPANGAESAHVATMEELSTLADAIETWSRELGAATENAAV